ALDCVYHQVSVHSLGVAREHPRLSRKHLALALQHIGLIRDCQASPKPLLRNQDRDLQVSDCKDGLEYLVHELRHDALRWLIQHEQARPGHQRPADREHLLLPARKRLRPLRKPLFELWEKPENLLERRLAILKLAVKIAAKP